MRRESIEILMKNVVIFAKICTRFWKKTEPLATIYWNNNVTVTCQQSPQTNSG